MAGGDFQFQAPQLRVMPIKVPSNEVLMRVTDNVNTIRDSLQNGLSLDDDELKTLLNDIDEDILSLYQLNDFEISRLLEIGSR